MQDFEFANKASEIARSAGALLREFYDRGVTTEYKGDVDLVTEADRASERLIRERLAAVFPDHGIYGEEGTREGLEREFRWYVDPLDGTTNFAHGFPAFCVVLGCEHRPAGLAPDADGEMVSGVIYDPLRNDLFQAEKGRSVAERAPDLGLEDRFAAGVFDGDGISSKKRHQSPNVHFYQEVTLRSHGVRRAGSAALDLAYVACGRLDGFWEFHLNPWDTSAGVLLVREAGGTVTHFDGGAWTLDSRETLATNGRIAKEISGLFTEMFRGRELTPIPTPAEFAARRVAAG